eukprot:TRINITY_DN92425_c0_g1_i1.p1 TRINITY_DN92425_c0_g1~~TRINITY_DN92425_c0_g1_i1.p1  ORF type:complete len:586 (-),score=101.82 TRINITY_DN92425_c0_g1_i1:362-2119(-)
MLLTEGAADTAAVWVTQLPLAQQWLERLNASASPRQCECRGFGPLPDLQIGRALGDGAAGDRPGEDLWQYIQRLDEFAASTSATSLTYVGGKSDLLETSGMLSYLLAHLPEAAADCAPGSASVLLMGLESMEINTHLQGAYKLFCIALALIVHGRALQCEQRFASIQPGFLGSHFVPYYRQLPLLFGLPSSAQRCIAGAPKIYIEEVDAKWTTPVLACATGLAATEVWLHRQLLFSDCAVASADEADFILVPMYARCLFARAHGIMEQGYSWEHPFTNATHWYSSLLGKLPSFRKRPQDHIFLFPEEHWQLPWPALSRGGPLERAIVLSPEGRPLQCGGRQDRGLPEEDASERPPCWHLPPRAHGGLVVIPSFIDGWRAGQLKAYNRPMRQRQVLACFMGLGVAKAYSMTENFRDKLRVLTGLPGFAVGPYQENYRMLMGDSVFCLVPKGVGTWSHRLYEAFLAGCVPVILSDDMLLPFPTLPWTTFSVKWPMRSVDATIFPEHLRKLHASGRAETMKEAVDRHACWFDYHSETPGCSPLIGITSQLRQRGRAAGPGGFWGISEDLRGDLLNPRGILTEVVNLAA